MPGSTIFHLIRHGDYSLLGQRLAGRSPGHSLSEKVHAQAAAVARALAATPVIGVVSSPLERTRETAEPIAAAFGLPVTIEADLTEIDFGHWTGRSFSDLRASPEWQVFNNFRATAPIPGGETMLQAQARAIGAVLRLRRAFPEGEVVAVSHGDVIKAILTHVLGIPLDLMRRIEVAPGSRSVVRLSDSDAQVLGVNLPPGA